MSDKITYMAEIGASSGDHDGLGARAIRLHVDQVVLDLAAFKVGDLVRLGGDAAKGFRLELDVRPPRRLPTRIEMGERHHIVRTRRVPGGMRLRTVRPQQVAVVGWSAGVLRLAPSPWLLATSDVLAADAAAAPAAMVAPLWLSGEKVSRDPWAELRGAVDGLNGALRGLGLVAEKAVVIEDGVVSVVVRI